MTLNITKLSSLRTSSGKFVSRKFMNISMDETINTVMSWAVSADSQCIRFELDKLVTTANIELKSDDDNDIPLFCYSLTLLNDYINGLKDGEVADISISLLDNAFFKTNGEEINTLNLR